MTVQDPSNPPPARGDDEERPSASDPRPDPLLARERDARQQAEFATRARDHLLGVVSHDLRSPLNGIQSWTLVLEAQLASDGAPLVKRALEGIKSGVEQQVRLIDGLLDVTRVLGGRAVLSTKDVDFAPIVQSVVDAAASDAAARQVRIVTQLAEVSIHGDPERLRQIASHLLDNALRHAPAGSEVHVALDAQDDALRLRVTDRGKGPAPETAPPPFEAFRPDESAHARGKSAFGLELALARRLAEMHQGRAEARDLGPGQGVAFDAILPRAPR